jgi:integrase
MKMNLTQNRLEALAWSGADSLHTFADGLAVRVYRGAAKGGLAHKAFWTRYTHAGQKKGVKIGACDKLSIAEALKEARAIQGEAARGKDPAAERAAAKRKLNDGDTLGKLIDRWQAIGLADKSPRYRRDAPHTLKRTLAKHLGGPAAALTKQAIVRRVDDFTEAGAPVMGARIVQYGRACFAWSIERGALTDNPFAGIKFAKANERERVLADHELRAILTEADQNDVFGALVWTLVLTGQRRGEVAGMTRDELSPDLATWTIPGGPRGRTKNRKTHDVPLSEPARTIIAARLADADGNFVFPGLNGRAFNNFHDEKIRLDGGAGTRGWTLHDLRRTCATNLQKIGVRLEVTEAVLNHVSGSRKGIVGVYQRYDWKDEKRAALNA